MVIAVLGVLKAGGAYVPLDAAYPLERLSLMVDDAQLSVLVAEEGQETDFVRSDLKVVRLNGATGECIEDVQWESREDWQAPTVTPENLAYVIYTSGSTGRPKGVAITHRSAVAFIQWARDIFAPSALAGVLASTSLSFDLSVFELFVTLSAGGKIILADNALHLPTLDAAHEVTLINTVPSAMAELLRMGTVPDSVQTINLAGEALPASLVQQIYRQTGVQQVWNLYGPSEDTTYSTSVLIEKDQSGPIVIGRPIANTQVYICDEVLQPVPVGVAGQLLLAGDGLARGYMGGPDLTAERFLPNPFSPEGGSRLYRTGDLVRYDQEGVLEFVGRIDEQVKLRGYRIELGEIEAVLRRHSQVTAAIVVLSETDGEKRLVAYVVGDAQAGELRAYLKEQLPDYMAPSFFVALTELPLLPNGKLNRRALPALESVSATAAGYEAPRTQMEELLAGLWSSVLRVSRVGINDNFFELGGHSLLAIQLVSRIRDAFSVELPLRELFKHRTVAALARSIDEQMRASHELVAPLLRRAVREDGLLLSYAQQRLWFLDQLAPGSVAYNVPSAVRLKGRLDVEALRRTLDEVVRRHEVLRTTFVAVNGEPVQVIALPSRLELPVMDLSKLPEEEREAEARQLVAAEAQRPFDLSVGPLLRVQLLRFGAEDQMVLFTMHHIITDGWSTGILVSELAALYEAYVEGRESPLPELEIQYADYTVWQREWLQGEVLEQQLSYWRQQLEELPVLQLPTDKPRPPVQSYRGRSFNFTVPAPLTAELKKLSNAEGVTLYMTLLATFKILLWRYSGQSDVVVGTPIAGRNHLATEGLIGLFVNTLVLRTSLSGDPSFRELLDRIREVTLGAYAHDNLPFEKLVEELQPERDMSRSPLFQVMFSLQNATAETLRLAGLEAIDTGVGDETAKFDLAFGLAEIGGELLGSLQYNVDLFDAATMERLVQHYELLLEGVVADPDRQLSQLPLLLEEDRHKLLVEWNDTHVVYDLEKCVHQLFEAQASQTPDAEAVVAGQVRLSYGELESRAEKLARRLRREGVGPEQRVGILVGRGAAMVVAPVGVLKAGGAYVPLDAAYPAERLSLMADDAQLSALVAEEGLNAEFVQPGVKIVRLDKATGDCIDDSFASDVELRIPNVTPENLAYVIYTSGSTGRPKGVAITHRSAVAFINWARDVFAPSALRGVLASTSLSFDLSVFELFVTLSSGGKMILADNALHLPTLEAAHEVTLINTVPSAMAELLRIGAAPAQVQTINLAGEALPASLVQQIYQQTGVQQVWNLYGPSEATTYSTSVLIEKNQSGPIVVGRPIANTQAYICDEMLQLLPIGVAGQLLLAGDDLARGYIGRPDLTAERFLPNPFSSEGGARLYVTGDLARYRADGQIEFLGRADNQLKLRGFRIEPGEIETRLREHPSVREAIVIATTEVDSDDKRLVAYVVTAHSGASVNDLRDYLRGTLPEYMAPSAFVLMNAFPLTPNGKIDRRALPLPDRATKSDSELTTPRNLLELQLIEIWKEVLRREQIGLRDNFFDLGGHSLLAMRLVDKVERLVEQKLPLSILFQGATVEQLAATLRQRGGKVREQLLVSIQPEGSRPPLFLVHSASGNVMSYVTLARRLGREQPVYGLQSKGLDPDRKPTARVEDMASEYLEELFAVQPEGPYFLGGWSMGGVIAFEMARQLTAQGKSVAPLVLIDSTIQTGRVKKNGLDDVSLLLALAEHHGLFLDDADHTFDHLRSLSLDEQLEFLLEKGAGYNQFPRDLGIPQLRHLFKLFKVNVHATEHYRPAKSEQQVILLQAADALPRHAAATLKRWKKVAEVVAAHRLPGDHYSIVTEPNVAVLAEQIKSVLTA
jgi:amino acid adenylation domain-containing protein